MRVRDKNNPERMLNAIQYYGERIAGFDGEYSEIPKWLGMVIKEYKDKTTIKLFDNQEVELNNNDWFIFDDSRGKVEILEVVSNEGFKNRFIQFYN